MKTPIDPSVFQGSIVMLFIRSVLLGALAGALLGIGTASAGNERLLESRESLYNNIYVYERPPYVIMTFGHNKQLYTETVFDTGDDRALPVPYTRLMTAALMYAKNVH